MAKIYQYKSGMSNGFFVADEGGIIAVDSGAELGADVAARCCAECGIEPGDIRLLVVTHAHADHFVNMDELRKLTGAPLLCHESAEPALREARLPTVYPRNKTGEEVDAFRIKMTALHGEPVPDLPPMVPDLTFTGEFDLRPYDVKGTIIETPGHSLICTSVVLDDRQAIVGDLIVGDEFTNHAPALAYYGCDPDRHKANDLLFASCERLLALSDTFHSGHGGPFTREEFTTALQAARAEDGREGNG